MMFSSNISSRLQAVYKGLLSAIVVSILLFCFSCQKSKTQGQTQPESFVMMGIDISHHNSVVSWEKLEQERVHFVYMKATEGTTHQDTHYTDSYSAIRLSAVKLGAYHFYSFGISGREQARHFIRISQLRAGDLVPAIDVEHSPTNPYSSDQQYIAKVIRELKELEDELYQHFGVHPLIYTNNNCYKLYVDGHFPKNPLWIVDLEKQPSADIPNWKIWQYSHMGRVAGIKGNVDLNYYRYTSKEFSELILPH